MIQVSFVCDDKPQSERLIAVVKEFFELEEVSGIATKKIPLWELMEEED